MHRTYDDWKTTEPDPYADEPVGECDCCGKRRPLTQCWLYRKDHYRGLETWACDECRGLEDDDHE